MQVFMGMRMLYAGVHGDEDVVCRCSTGYGISSGALCGHEFPI